MLTKNEKYTLQLVQWKLYMRDAETLADALMQVAFQFPHRVEAVERLMGYVGRALYPFRTLYAWQFEHGIIGRDAAQLRADQIAWIAWMLGD